MESSTLYEPLHSLIGGCDVGVGFGAASLVGGVGVGVRMLGRAVKPHGKGFLDGCQVVNVFECFEHSTL